MSITMAPNASDIHSNTLLNEEEEEEEEDFAQSNNHCVGAHPLCQRSEPANQASIPPMLLS